MKKCNFCAEEIQNEALKCKHCWSDASENRMKRDHKDKIVAGMLAVFFGCIGAHKFYLWKKWQGLLYLFFCWTFIPAIIGFIEGIWYLVRSSEVWEMEYNGWDLLGRQEVVRAETRADVPHVIIASAAKMSSLTQHQDLRDKLIAFPQHVKNYAHTDYEVLSRLEHMEDKEFIRFVEGRIRKEQLLRLYGIGAALVILWMAIPGNLWTALMASMLAIPWLHPKKGEKAFIAMHRLRNIKDYRFRAFITLPLLLILAVSWITKAGNVQQSRIAEEESLKAPTPVITVTSPLETNSSSTGYILAFTLSGATEVKVNAKDIAFLTGWTYTETVSLQEQTTVVTVFAKNAYKHAIQSVAVHRNPTQEELSKMAEEKKINDLRIKKEGEEKKRVVDLETKELREWNTSKAWKACNAHPNWTKDECIRLTAGKIWIGMTYDMLVYTSGKPDSANPSNYWAGTRWQWCWHDTRPSCFYDSNGDGLVDSYN